MGATHPPPKLVSTFAPFRGHPSESHPHLHPVSATLPTFTRLALLSGIPMRRPFFFLAATLVTFTTSAFARDYRVTLAAPTADLAGQVVAFTLPADAPKSASLRDSSGQIVPLQIDADGTARFIIATQKSGAALAYTFTSAPATPPPTAPAPGVAFTRDPADLRFTIGGAPVLSYRLDRAAVPRSDIKPEIFRAGYIHPVFSPAGKLVTDDYPSNHVHHHGIWAPWTKTSFQGRSPDFWNMQNKTGAEDLVAIDRTWSGPVHGGLEARLHSVDLSAPTPITALNTTWSLTLYAVPAAATTTPVRMFDLTVTHTCATSDALQLPQYHYGGFGLRGSAAWNGPGEAARFLTSAGLTDRIKGNDSRARWCYLGGAVTPTGDLAGTAVLGHPDNFRAPQPVRLHPDMPYFSFVPQQLGAFAIPPGKPYVARFRFIVTDGAPDRAFLDACWRAYAEPAVVTLAPL